MTKREKPKIGTTLVPSIENIEGCHRYGGVWNRTEAICHEKQPLPGYDGCFAPVKGVNVCYVKSADNNYIYSKMDHVLAATGDVVHSKRVKYDLMDAASISVESKARDEYYRILGGRFWEKPICCSPRGKIISCNSPNAIMTNNGDNITAISHSYRNKFGDKTIADMMPVKRGYDPEPVLDKKHDTKFSSIEGIPALEKDGKYFRMVSRVKPEISRLPLKNLEEKAIDRALVNKKGNKVPNIETVKDCFSYGGYWDKKNSVCMQSNWCTAPVKGVSCCWGAYEADCDKYDEETGDYLPEFEESPCYEPVVTCQVAVDHDGPRGDSLVYDTSYNGGEVFRDDSRNAYSGGMEYPDNEEEAMDAAKSHAMDVVTSIRDGGASYWGDLDYYNPLGEPADDDDPFAIALDDPKKARFYKHLIPFMPKEEIARYRRYKPMPDEYMRSLYDFEKKRRPKAT